MALCNRCDVEIGFAQTPGGKWQPVDALSGEPHRCAKTKAPAVNNGGSLERQANTGAKIAWSSMNPLPREEIVGPMRRTELQELRHAVQRLSRAVELLTEQVERAALREMAQ